MKWGSAWVALKAMRVFSRYYMKDDAWKREMQGTPRLLNRADYLLDLVKGKKVWHFGFADAPFTTERVQQKKLLHMRMQAVAEDVYGLDYDADAVALYTQLTGDEKVQVFDLMDLEGAVPANVFAPDLVLLGEVMEHLPDPMIALKNLHMLLPASAKLVITVPNVFALQNFAAAVQHYESVHPDHYWYYSPFTFSKLAALCGFTVTQTDFGMYYGQGTQPNSLLAGNAWLGDCLIMVLEKSKN